MEPTIYVVGTFDTKSAELFYLRDCLKQSLQRSSIDVVTVDISTHPAHYNQSPADISPLEVAKFHPYQLDAEDIFLPSRSAAINSMLRAFEGFVSAKSNIAGILGAGGSSGAALVSPGMQSLKLGIPKFLISALSANDIANYISGSNITLINSTCDINGLNTITQQILSHGASALAGIINTGFQSGLYTRPTIAISTFGATSSCTHFIRQELSENYDCFLFSALGQSGDNMQATAEKTHCRAIFDIAPADIADRLFGSTFSSGNHRFESLLKTQKPYIGSVGALDMVRFGRAESIPIELSDRKLHIYNPSTTLMRTSADENKRMGQWIAEQLNECTGPVRLLIPEKGFSSLSVQGQEFYDPKADKALIEALHQHFKPAPNRQLITLPYAISDEEFSRALLEQFIEIAPH